MDEQEIISAEQAREVLRQERATAQSSCQRELQEVLTRCNCELRPILKLPTGEMVTVEGMLRTLRIDAQVEFRLESR